MKLSSFVRAMGGCFAPSRKRFRGAWSAARPRRQSEVLDARVLLSAASYEYEQLVGSKGDASPYEVEAVPGQWISRFDGIDGAADEQLLEIKRALNAAGIAGVSVSQPLGLPGMVSLITSPALSSDSLSDELSRIPGFRYVVPDYIVRGNELLPNDPSFGELYGLSNTGQTILGSSGVPDADIDATDAWDITTGSSSVVVGVIDSGIDFTHPDLIPNIWTNSGENPGDGIDNDGNGFIDDVHGWDFWDGDNDPSDQNGHGTHVSGTIGASGNNGVGVAGVNWDVTIMPIRFLGPDNFGSLAGAVSAINYATMMRNNGVNLKVTNNSWGAYFNYQPLADAIAAHESAGILLVASAGNDSNNNDFSPNYPASYGFSNIISVAATDNWDNRSWFSNYGSGTVDLGAPGSAILSTVPSFINPGGYEYFWGTSMAAPHVTGVAALAWSVAPTASYQRIRDAILNGVDPNPSLSGITVTGGRLNAYNTLLQLGLKVESTSPEADSVVATAPTSFVVNFSDAFDPTSIEAGDLTVNGVAADSLSIDDADSVTFVYSASPVTAEGLQTMSIAAGAIAPAVGNLPFNGYSGEFRYDTVPLQVVATNPPFSGGTFTLPGPLVLEVVFNEPVDPGSVTETDLVLSGIADAVVTGVLVSPDGLTAAFTIDGVSGEGTLEGSLAAGAITDVHGNIGEEFSASYRVDFGNVAYPVPLTPVQPPGSLIHDQEIRGEIDPSGDTDSFTLSVDGGQTITVLVTTPVSGMYAGVGRQGLNSGSVLLVNQTNGSSTLLGKPTPAGNGLSGLDFTDDGRLFGISIGGGPRFSTLIEIDPATGGLKETIGAITDGPGGPVIAIGDLAIQPGSNTLYGVRSNADGQGRGGFLYTIDAASGVATFVADLQSLAGGGLDFAPDGTLYQSSYNASTFLPALNTIDPNTGARIASVPLPFYFDGLGVSPDGILFASGGGPGPGIYTINPGSGEISFIGNSLAGGPSDLTFSPPATLRPVVSIVDGQGVIVASASAAAPGGAALLQTFRVPGQLGTVAAPKEYTITVGGAGGTTGEYTTEVILNAAVEAEGFGGTDNGVPSQAQNLEGSFIALHSGNNSGNSPQPKRGAVLGLLSSSTDADQYRFDLSTGQTATIALTSLSGGNANLSLVGPTGAVLALGANSASNVDELIGNFIATSTGTYILRVSGDPGTAYSLLVTRNAGFDTENNNTIETSRPIVGPEVAGARWVLGAIEAPETSGLYTTGNNGTQLITIDPDTGAGRLVGPFGTFDTFTAAFTPDGQLWTIINGFSPSLAQLATVDPLTGVATPVGTPNWTGSPLFSMDADSQGQLYAGNWDGMFFSVDTTTGQMTPIGFMGFYNTMDFAFDNDGTLWALDAGFNLYTIDPATGAGTYQASLSGMNEMAMGLMVDPEDNGLYATSYAFDSNLYRIDPLTGVATLAGPVGIPYPHGGDFAPSGAPPADYYRISADGNRTIEIATQIPASQSGEFVNNLDPEIHLYDSAGNLLASNDNGAPDGRNARLSYKVPKGKGGDFYISVRSSSSSSDLTTGEYILSVKNAKASQVPFAVAAIDPSDGERVRGPVTELTVDFNDGFLLSSLQASDVSVDGQPAFSVTIVDGDTAVFGISQILNEGNHSVTISAGAVTDLQGTPIQAFSSSFYHDVIAPQVVSSSIQQGASLADGFQDLTVTISFSEAMNTASVDLFDVVLAGQLTGSYFNPSNISFSTDGTEVTIVFLGVFLNEDLYQLSLLSGDFGFQDVVGWDLDGEALNWPIPSNSSGDGIEGGNFVVDFTVDASIREVPVPLVAIEPLGSLIYQTPSAAFGVAAPLDDTDDWTIPLEAGQTISVLFSPSLGLLGTIEVLGPAGELLGSAAGSVAGGNVLLQAVSAGTDGTYTIRVGGTAGTVGSYDFQLFVNTLLEEESWGGATNDDLFSAQSLDAGAISLTGGGDRSAILGQTPSTTGVIPEFEPNDDPADSQNIDGGPWNTDFDPNTYLSTDLPHLSIAGTGDGTYDYYEFTVAGSGDFGIFDLDFTTGFDTWLDLFDSFGNILATSDDNAGDPGSTSSVDSLIAYNFPAAGTYFIRVAGFPALPVPFGVSYVLNVSLQGHALNPPSAAPDTFSLTLSDGQSVSIAGTALSTGNVSLSLFDAGGNLVAAGADVGTNISEVLTFAGGPAGTYYVQVTSDSAVEYSLVVTRDAVFEIEDNGSPADAQNLDLASGSATVLGHATSSGSAIMFAAASGFPGEILRVDSSTGQIVGSIPAPVPVGNGPDGLGYDGGHLFLINSFYNDQLWELDPVTGAVLDVDSLGTGLDFIDGVAVLNGLVYIANSSTDRILVFDPATDTILNILSPGIDLGGGLSAISGPDALVASVGFGYLALIDPVTGSITANIFPFVGGIYGLGVVNNQILIGGVDGAIFTLTREGTFVSSTVFPYLVFAIGADNLVSSVPSDYYQIHVANGDDLVISTSTPGGGPGEFVNALDPVLRVYDELGNQIAESDNDAADGRNATLLLENLASGTYYIEVVAAAGTSGEYVVNVNTSVAELSQASAMASADVMYWNPQVNDTSGTLTLPGNEVAEGDPGSLMNKEESVRVLPSEAGDGLFDDDGRLSSVPHNFDGWRRSAPTEDLYDLNLAISALAEDMFLPSGL